MQGWMNYIFILVKMRDNVVNICVQPLACNSQFHIVNTGEFRDNSVSLEKIPHSAKTGRT